MLEDFSLLFIATVLAVESLCLLLLCMPMPSNELRTHLVKFFTDLGRSKQVQKIIAGLFIANALLFANSLRVMLHVGDKMDDDDFDEKDGEIVLFYTLRFLKQQRNVVLSGLAVLQLIILCRLVQLLQSLTQARAFAKANGIKLPLGDFPAPSAPPMTANSGEKQPEAVKLAPVGDDLRRRKAE